MKKLIIIIIISLVLIIIGFWGYPFFIKKSLPNKNYPNHPNEPIVTQNVKNVFLNLNIKIEDSIPDRSIKS